MAAELDTESEAVFAGSLDSASVVTDSIADVEPVASTVNSEKPEDLMEFMENSGKWEQYDAGILPDMIHKSTSYVKKLLNNQYGGFIAVDKSRMKVILFDKFGVERKSYGMACAKNFGTKHEKGDSKTPEGFFYVEGIYDSTDWLFTDDDGVTSKKKGQFGPRFIRLRIPGTSQIGIHGTCAPWSIGARASHGCIRIKNENILELVELVEIGMPVIVVPGRRDLEQNYTDGVDIPWIPTVKGAKEPKFRKVEKTDIQPKDTVCVGDSIISPRDSISVTPFVSDSISETDAHPMDVQ
ncbi:MAG: L,D-transpeptidase [Muribaculaceae bacterium]|nr:L,D-transpeptidase [Muribaculaceae bacterium]